ncbi:MAG: toll/interleukin-1 receptor domain-containing protein [Myxococcota bacterium]
MSDTAPPTFRYWAFISYSRRDARWGQWVQRRLERFRIPSSLAGTKRRWGLVPRRLHPVFLDKFDLASASNISEALRAKLRASHSLVVICSPHSASSKWVSAETEEFKALGRDHHIYCLVVGGDPDTPIVELLPPPLRSDDDALPLASDLRPGGDSRTLAIRKLVAGILDVSPDDLAARAQLQSRRTRRLGALAGLAATSLVTASYVAAADAGLQVPAGEPIRAWLDGQDASWFRAVPTLPAIRAKARALRTQMLERLAERPRIDGGWVVNNPNETPCYDAWSNSQVNTAALLAREPSLVDTQLRLLDGLLQPQHTPQGENRCPDPRMRVDVAQNEIMLVGAWWHLWALGEALRRPDLLDETRLGEVRSGVAVMTRVLRPERVSGTAEGSWVMWPWMEDRSHGSPYTATLALLAMMALQDAGVPWNGSDETGRATARWLLSAYRPHPERGGWVEPSDFNATEPYDGMRFQTIEALLDAERRGWVTIPTPTLIEWEGFLLACGERALDFPMMSAAVAETQRPPGGEQAMGQESMAFQWHPWAIRAVVAWLDRAARHPRPHVLHTRMRRTLAHLVVELGDAAVEKTTHEWLWQPAELAIGLTALEEPFDPQSAD